MKRYIAIIATAFALVSCNEWLDNTQNNTYLTDGLVWSDASSAELYVNGFWIHPTL